MKKFYENLINGFFKKTKLEKIILHSGISKYEKDFIKEIFNCYFYLFDQKPVFTKIKKSISNFKSKKGDLAGIFVTLRKTKMWNFYHKLITVVIPKIKEFKGYNLSSIDRFGNLNFGIENCNVFPDFDKNIKFGINVNLILKNAIGNFKNFYKIINFPVN